jgi:hypothetical protein
VKEFVNNSIAHPVELAHGIERILVHLSDDKERLRNLKQWDTACALPYNFV